jgi:hypothetical protein
VRHTSSTNTSPDSKLSMSAVPGILTPGMYNGTHVNLLPYFNGALLSTNTGGSSGASVNFLDDGGAVPLTMNMPSNGTTSNQYMLLTHLYEFFGALLGCSMMNTTDYPAYSGEASMYEVHKFMDLSYAEMGYFITQVALSAASFGVAQEDIAVVGQALGKLFDYKCSPPTTVIPSQGAQLQSICTGDGCPLDPNAVCAQYQNISAPGNATSSSMSGSATGTATMAAGGASGTATGTAAVVTASRAAAPGTFVMPAGVAFFGAAFAYLL